MPEGPGTSAFGTGSGVGTEGVTPTVDAGFRVLGFTRLMGFVGLASAGEVAWLLPVLS